MTTLEAEIKLIEMFDMRRSIIVHCVTPLSMIIHFEADILILTRSGYATVIEIKVSKQDLKNDLKKKHIKAVSNPTLFKKFYQEIKHFYYAVPRNLIKDAERQIPEFCGIINLDTLKVYREPRKLFPKKWSRSKRMRLMKLGCMRILTLKKNILDLKKIKK